jgi:hypothetical protein
MNAKAAQQLATLLARLDQQRRTRKTLTQQVISSLWWLDKRIAPRYGGDAA